MAGRRGKGEGNIFFDNARQRWVGQATYYQDGKRKRKWVSARTRQEAAQKLRQILLQLDAGMAPPPERLTVGQFLER